MLTSYSPDCVSSISDSFIRVGVVNIIFPGGRVVNIRFPEVGVINIRIPMVGLVKIRFPGLGVINISMQGWVSSTSDSQE